MSGNTIDRGWTKARSLFFVPAHVQRFFNKSLASNADVIVLDLEDGVPAENKKEARENLKFFAASRSLEKKLLVRVNPISSEFYLDDISACVEASVDGIVLPKVKTRENVLTIVSCLRNLQASQTEVNNFIALFPLIEDAQAVLNVREIAGASKAVKGLIFGHEDYLNDINAVNSQSNQNLLVARTLVVLAAREHNIVPIDTPFLYLKDSDGCLNHAKSGRELGFLGMLVLHPDQVDIVNCVYSPSLDEIKRAQEILEIMEDAKLNGRSIAFAKGKFVAPPIVKQAESLLFRARSLNLLQDGF